ncbi:MAG: isoleucine--tRNA ligase, partial [Candidatus Pacearchaeota archaeon]|nr:isoleucine--tRNA ligase [Candidatus Pacearchaeota archaeon]
MVNINEISNQEDKVNEFWKKAEIFKKSVEKDAPNGDYVFYDGPPFITGLPHYGTLLTSIPKDVVPRFQTMNGKRVQRVWGWDCHGLPAENKVEKELNLKNKQDIENIGVGKFVSACKNYVNNVSSQWDWYINKIGRWVDMENAYRTMDLNFMESIIWGFKQLYDKGLIYEGYRCSLHCPRCATPLSKFEITMDAGSYKDVTEQSVIIKFHLKPNQKWADGKYETKDKVYTLAWTTTPWTLPGNLALAVGKDIKYSAVRIDGVKELLIIATDRINDVLKGHEIEVVHEDITGKDLIGLEYEPLFELDKKAELNDNVHKIYNADFVTTEDGTGIVHIAPNFGEDDFLLGKEFGLPVLELMDENGVYTKLCGKDFEGLYFKDANKVAIKKLEESRRLFSKFNYTHTYPFCYRCETPLIYKVQKAWYMDIDKIRDSMLKTNENINWVPDYFKEGRFKHNLETAPHWCLSRSRYWGSPIPVWRCEKCNELKVVGSIEEIQNLSGKEVKDLHRPEIDEHKFSCTKCDGKMKRVEEVFDCWFESGGMSYAQFHYPFEKKDEFKNIFPADFIIEYTGQLRGWFYTLHAVSNALFNSESFRNVVCHGVLAGTDGRKMSKSYGNYPDPKETLEKYGADSIRMYFLTSPLFIGGDMNLSEK